MTSRWAIIICYKPGSLLIQYSPTVLIERRIKHSEVCIKRIRQNSLSRVAFIEKTSRWAIIICYKPGSLLIQYSPTVLIERRIKHSEVCIKRIRQNSLSRVARRIYQEKSNLIYWLWQFALSAVLEVVCPQTRGLSNIHDLIRVVKVISPPVWLVRVVK